MNDLEMHVSDEQLDRLRAGLLDDAPAEKARISAHLAHCTRCHGRHGLWGDLVAKLNTGVAQSASERLAGVRRLALQARGRQTSYAAARLALAASITLALGLGLYINLDSLQPDPASAPTLVADAADADLFSELDFYVWLAQQDDGSAADSNET